MSLIQPVYIVSTPDGVHDFMTVAKSQKQAAEKMGMSLSYCRRQGLHRITPDNHAKSVLVQIANSAPERVWKQKVDYVTPQCWVFADQREQDLKEQAEARRRAFAYMDGFRCAAGMTPAEPGMGSDPDYLAGRKAGKAAKDAARREAERLTGYRFAVLRPASHEGGAG
jgi:hypothetical protein